jgi:hypothetical protein
MGNTSGKSLVDQSNWQISAKEVIMTRTGPRQVDNIKHDEIIEISSNVGWIQVRRTAIKYGQIVRVDISDGTHFSVSPNTNLSIEYGEVVAAGNLKVEDKLMSIFNDNVYEVNNTIDWVSQGRMYGIKSLKNIQHEYTFPHDKESCLDFIEGWTIAQGGQITGSEFEIMCFYHIFKIADIHDLFIDQLFDGRYKILAHSSHFRGEKYKWNIPMSKRNRFITSIATMNKVRVCSFEFVNPQDNINLIDLGMILIHNERELVERPLAREYSVAITPPSSPVDKKNISPASSINGSLIDEEVMQEIIAV